MPFRFNNYARPVGRRGNYEWFEWRVFMDEPPETLSGVERVEYRLHQTFPTPIRVVDDRRSRFALQTSGWGEFTIFISVFLTNGNEEHTEYELDLDKPWPRDGG